VRIVKYPHPTLRHKSKPLRRVDAELRKIVVEMFELMYLHKGVGLSANQVDLPYRLFILNIDPDEAKAGERVFINPVLSRWSGTAEADEGCLSFPEIYAPVKRAEKNRRHRLQPLGRRSAVRTHGPLRPRGPT